MSGFFTVTDVPSRRVVQYKRVAHSGEDVIYIQDESILGDPINEMPYADKTGLAVTSGYFGMLYELPYLPDAGDVYFSGQPADGEAGDLVSAMAKGGAEPYAYQWFYNGQMVVDLSTPAYALKANKPGKYFVKVTDANGVEAVSKEAEVK